MKRLNKAELYAIQRMQLEVQQAEEMLNAANRQMEEMLRSVGLEPGVAYRIDADGSVTEPEKEE